MGCKALSDDELVEKIKESGVVFREISPEEVKRMIEEKKRRIKIRKEK